MTLANVNHVNRAASRIWPLGRALGQNLETCIWCKGEKEKSLGKTSISAIFLRVLRPRRRQSCI